MDPRTVRGRAGEGRLWEVGVWGPWSEVNLGWVRGEALESQGTEVKPEVVEEGARAVDEDAPMGEGKTTRVLLASRYLIAEGEA